MNNEIIAYTVPDAMRALGLGRTTIYRLIAEKRLDARKVGGRTLVTASSMRALLESSEAI